MLVEMGTLCISHSRSRFCSLLLPVSCLRGVAEEEHKVYFVTGHPGRDLLDAAQLPGEVAVHGQAGGLRQHPTGGTGGNDRVAG